MWSVYYKTLNTGFNNGDIWSYYYDEPIIKSFDDENVTAMDIYSPYELRTKIEKNGLEGFYHGETRNGNANDETDEAYMVKYFYITDDKTQITSNYVRTFYTGHFRNGNFHDDTGNAKEIVYDASTDNYFSYIGTFTDGERDREDLNTGLSIDDINRLLDGIRIECPLQWLHLEGNIA